MEGTADIREVEDAAKVRGLSRVPPDPTRDGCPTFVGRPETAPTRARTPPDFDTILPFPTANPQARLRVLHRLDAAFLSGASEVRAPSDPTHRPISNHPRGVPRFSTPDTPPPSSAHPRVPGPAGALRPHIRRSLRALPGPRRRPPGRRRRRRRRARRARLARRRPPGVLPAPSLPTLARAPGIPPPRRASSPRRAAHPGPTHRRRHPSRPTPRRAPEPPVGGVRARDPSRLRASRRRRRRVDPRARRARRRSPRRGPRRGNHRRARGFRATTRTRRRIPRRVRNARRRASFRVVGVVATRER